MESTCADSDTTSRYNRGEPENRKSNISRCFHDFQVIHKSKLYINNFQPDKINQIQKLFKKYGPIQIATDNQKWLRITYPNEETAKRAMNEVRRDYNDRIGIHFCRDKIRDPGNQALNNAAVYRNSLIKETVHAEFQRPSESSNNTIGKNPIPKCANPDCPKKTLDECLQCHTNFCSKVCMVFGYQAHTDNCILLPPHSTEKPMDRSSVDTNGFKNFVNGLPRADNAVSRNGPMSYSDNFQFASNTHLSSTSVNEKFENSLELRKELQPYVYNRVTLEEGKQYKVCVDDIMQISDYHVIMLHFVEDEELLTQMEAELNSEAHLQNLRLVDNVKCLFCADEARLRAKVTSLNPLQVRLIDHQFRSISVNEEFLRALPRKFKNPRSFSYQSKFIDDTPHSLLKNFFDNRISFDVIYQGRDKAFTYLFKLMKSTDEDETKSVCEMNIITEEPDKKILSLGLDESNVAAEEKKPADLKFSKSSLANGNELTIISYDEPMQSYEKFKELEKREETEMKLDNSNELDFKSSKEKRVKMGYLDKRLFLSVDKMKVNESKFAVQECKESGPNRSNIESDIKENEPFIEKLTPSVSDFLDKIEKVNESKVTVQKNEESVLNYSNIESDRKENETPVGEFKSSVCDYSAEYNSKFQFRIELGKTVEAIVPHSEGTTLFIGSCAEIQLIDQLIKKLPDVDALPTLDEIKLGERCLALYEEEWFRAVIISEKYPLLVRYEDFGNIEEIKETSLKELPESLKDIPPLVTKVKLEENIGPIKGILKCVPVAWDFEDGTWIISNQQTIRIRVKLSGMVDRINNWCWVIPLVNCIELDKITNISETSILTEIRIGVICLYQFKEIKKRVKIIYLNPLTVQYTDSFPEEITVERDQLFVLPKKYATCPSMVMKIRLQKIPPCNFGLNSCFDVVKNLGSDEWSVESLQS